jgi:TrbL/VirB6 plasmid conjugal transfer protein
MAGIDPFASITAAVLDLLTRDGDLFLSLGTNLFRGLAVIVVVWFGLQTALASAEGRGRVPVSHLASLLLTIAFGLAMITYYRAPIPGLGLSFTQLLTDQPIFLARQLEVTQVQRLSERLNELYLSLEQPSVFNVSAIVGYFLVALAVTAARVALLAVIAFGLVATGVAVLVGPVFIPFFWSRRSTGSSGAG